MLYFLHLLLLAGFACAIPVPKIVTLYHTASTVTSTSTYITGTTTIWLPPVEIFISNGVTYTITRSEDQWATTAVTTTSSYNDIDATTTSQATSTDATNTAVTSAEAATTAATSTANTAVTSDAANTQVVSTYTSSAGAASASADAQSSVQSELTTSSTPASLVATTSAASSAVESVAVASASPSSTPAGTSLAPSAEQISLEQVSSTTSHVAQTSAGQVSFASSLVETSNSQEISDVLQSSTVSSAAAVTSSTAEVYSSAPVSSSAAPVSSSAAQVTSSAAQVTSSAVQEASSSAAQDTSSAAPVSSSTVQETSSAAQDTSSTVQETSSSAAQLTSSAVQETSSSAAQETSSSAAQVTSSSTTQVSSSMTTSTTSASEVASESSTDTSSTSTSSALLSPPSVIVYSPYNSDGSCKDYDSVETDLNYIYGKGIYKIRLYGADCNTFSAVLPLATSLGMTVNQGLWISSAGVDSIDDYTTSLISYGQTNGWDVFDYITIGNEAINAGYVTVDELISKISSVKTQLNDAGYSGTVTTSEPPATFIEYPELCTDSEIDFVGINPHSYFNENLYASESGAYITEQQAQVAALCSKLAVITETGYPSQGDTNGNNVPSAENQYLAIKSIIEYTGGDVTILTTYNDFWKEPGTYGIEQYFGAAHLFS